MYPLFTIPLAPQPLELAPPSWEWTPPTWAPPSLAPPSRGLTQPSWALPKLLEWLSTKHLKMALQSWAPQSFSPQALAPRPRFHLGLVLPILVPRLILPYLVLTKLRHHP